MSEKTRWTKIVLAGKKYKLYIDLAITDGTLVPIPLYKIGNKYKHRNGEIYALVLVSIGIVALVNSTTYLTYSGKYISVTNADNITEDEWFEIIDNRDGFFTEVEE